MNIFLLFFLCCCYLRVGFCESNQTNEENLNNIGKHLVEEGRTFVHHTLKRFMIILPAIFFKLGIAFTLLILVTIVAVNNGFIGFLLLVVGISSVLARLQEARRPYHHIGPIPVPLSAPHYHHYDWDRNDNFNNKQQQQQDTLAIFGQQHQSLPTNYLKYTR